MPFHHVVMLLLTVLASARASDAAAPVTCMRASGNADARCLDRYADLVARCRARQDAACEAAVRADGGALDAALARPEDPSRDACTDEASEALALEVAEQAAAQLGRAFKPDRVVFVSALPKTRSAKIVRRAVRAKALGKDPGDLSSVENPEALEEIARAV